MCTCTFLNFSQLINILKIVFFQLRPPIRVADPNQVGLGPFLPDPDDLNETKNKSNKLNKYFLKITFFKYDQNNSEKEAKNCEINEENKSRFLYCRSARFQSQFGFDALPTD